MLLACVCVYASVAAAMSTRQAFIEMSFKGRKKNIATFVEVGWKVN